MAELKGLVQPKPLCDSNGLLIYHEDFLRPLNPALVVHQTCLRLVLELVRVEAACCQPLSSLLSHGRDPKWHKIRESEWKEPRNVCLHVESHRGNGLPLVLTSDTCLPR